MSLFVFPQDSNQRSEESHEPVGLINEDRSVCVLVPTKRRVVTADRQTGDQQETSGFYCDVFPSAGGEDVLRNICACVLPDRCCTPNAPVSRRFVNSFNKTTDGETLEPRLKPISAKEIK